MLLELLSEQFEGFDVVRWREDATGLSVLHVAIHSERVDLVALLLERECDVNAMALDGSTPLYTACVRGRLDIVKLLVGHGADIHHSRFTATWNLEDGGQDGATQIDGLTPLDCALGHNRMEVVDYLLARGARASSTSLGMAIHRHWECPAVQVCHLHVYPDRHGPNVTPNRHCVHHVDVVQRLLAAGIEGRFDSGFYKEVVLRATKRGRGAVSTSAKKVDLSLTRDNYCHAMF